MLGNISESMSVAPSSISDVTQSKISFASVTFPNYRQLGLFLIAIKFFIPNFRQMSEAQAIALYYPLLNTIAVKIIGCRDAAEDIVQETYLKWLSYGPEKVRNTKAFLITSVRNNCIKYMESLPVKKQEWLEKLPKDWTDKFSFHPQIPGFVEEEVREAIAAVHHKLEPLEKGIFILRGIFQLEYEELQEIFQKKNDHCRKLFSRARKKLQSASVQENITDPEVNQLWSKVDHAFRKGALNELINYLKSRG